MAENSSYILKTLEAPHKSIEILIIFTKEGLSARE